MKLLIHGYSIHIMVHVKYSKHKICTAATEFVIIIYTMRCLLYIRIRNAFSVNRFGVHQFLSLVLERNHKFYSDVQCRYNFVCLTYVHEKQVGNIFLYVELSSRCDVTSNTCIHTSI